MYDLAALTALAEDYPARAVLLSGQTIVLALAALQNMEHRGQWESSGLPLTDAEEDERDIIVSQAFYEIMFSEAELSMPGQIISFAGATIPSGYLDCDGSVVLQDDFPNLYTAIGATWNVGGEASDAFRLPDLRGRTMIGDGDGALTSNRVLGSSGGAETHALTVGQLPEHTHGVPVASADGTSTVNARSGTLANFIGHVLTAASGAESITGGNNETHPNMQPFAVVKFIIKV